MADTEEKAKAEKLAAAKKRVEQMKKQKQKKAEAKKEDKAESTTETPKDSTPEPPAQEEEKETEPSEPPAEEPVAELSTTSRERQPSLSLQSKLRSSSFRQSSGGPLSPGYTFSSEGDTAPDIHRKQAIKIDELERENKRLAKEASDAEKRWKKAEEDLEDLREAEDDSGLKTKDVSTTGAESSAEVEKLKSEIVSLQRQNTQLVSRTSRHGSSPSVSLISPPSDYETILASKSSIIESMEIEISNLRSRLEKSSSSSPEKEQILALEEKLSRSEKAANTANRELGDIKKNLERTTEKAVKEGSSRISAETKLRTFGEEAEESRAKSEELQKKIDGLEKKVATLGTLHKEHDARFQSQKRSLESANKDTSELRSRIASIENENLRLKEERDRVRKRDAQGVDDEGVDELENEERERLEKKVRTLESEVHELRRGVWKEKRGMSGEESTSPSARFTDIDLGGASPSRRRSIAPGGKGFSDLLTSGFNAITGANAYPHQTNGGSGDDLLEDDDDELLDFDEEAFRIAQEEEMKKRIERVKETKRGLKNWEGWRLDLVEERRGGGEGVGEIFEV